MLACLLSDKGSLGVFGRSSMPSGNPESVSMSDMMVKPTPVSHPSSRLHSLQKNL